jgi:hypothetical protein
VATTLAKRIGLLETTVRELRRVVEMGARYGPQSSSEVLYRMWQAEREDNIRLRMLMQERERQHEAFRERVESGLQLLCDRAGEVSARLAGVRQIGEIVHDPADPRSSLSAAEQRIVNKFAGELQKGQCRCEETDGKGCPIPMHRQVEY